MPVALGSGAVSRPGPARDTAGGEPDAELLRMRLQAGDEVLFRQVVTEFTPMLTRLARVYTPSIEAAQDAVQDTWLIVIDKLGSFDGRSTFRTWVSAILVRTARRTGVREARAVPFSSVWVDDREPAVDPARFCSRRDPGPTGSWLTPPVGWDEIPEDRLTASELQAVIAAAISALPIRQRAVITARDVLDMDAGAAATALGLTSGNQRVLLHRARSKVRAALELYSARVSAHPDNRSEARGGRAEDLS